MKLRDLPSKTKELLLSAKGIFNSFKGTHRLVIVDDETLKEKLSVKLTGINVFVGVGLGIILLIAITTFIIAFTPLREYIPGYANQDMVEQTYRNAVVIDSLEQVVNSQDLLIRSIQSAILGTDPEEEPQLAALDSAKWIGPVNYSHSRADSLLRREVETQFNIKL